MQPMHKEICWDYHFCKTWKPQIHIISKPMSSSSLVPRLLFHTKRLQFFCPMNGAIRCMWTSSSTKLLVNLLTSRTFGSKYLHKIQSSMAILFYRRVGTRTSTSLSLCMQTRGHMLSRIHFIVSVSIPSLHKTRSLAWMNLASCWLQYQTAAVWLQINWRRCHSQLWKLPWTQ